MIRRSLLAVAALVALSGPAMADGLITGGLPLVNTSSFTASNTAAGIGNTAVQGIAATQQGARAGRLGGGALVNSNTASASNVAAGIGNTAVQGIDLTQRGSRRGALANSSSFNASNLSAGIGNFAGQQIFATQR